MELTSKQRAYLRGEAQTIDPIVMIGKDGLTENVTVALDEALTHHELVKVKFQQYKEDVKEIAFRCAELTSSVLVATTGFTAVFYRMKEKSEERIYAPDEKRGRDGSTPREAAVHGKVGEIQQFIGDVNTVGQ